jgi:hypothetical protein
VADDQEQPADDQTQQAEQQSSDQESACRVGAHASDSTRVTPASHVSAALG